MGEGMKIIVMSDSHGDREAIEKIARKEGDAHFHCGDSELAYEDPVFQSMHRVLGNCDMDYLFPEEVEVVVGSHKIYAVHGHRHNVKQSLITMFYKTRDKGANIALFGHSHLYSAEMKEGILFVNPGSTLLPRNGNPPTYAVIEWNEKVRVTFKNMDDEIVEVVEFEK